MKSRCFAALSLVLILAHSTSPVVAADPEKSVTTNSESLWVTSIAPLSGDQFVAGTATGLVLRPGTVSQFSAQSPKEFTKLYEHPAAVWTVDSTGDGKTVVSADYQGNLVVYDVESKKATTHEKVFERWCLKIAVAPDGKSAVAANEAGKIFVWNLKDSKVSKSLELGKTAVTSIAFSPSKDQLAATDGEGKVHLLKWPELETVGVVSISDETAWCVAYQNDAALIVGSGDRNLYRVDAKPDAKPESVAKGSDWITRIAVSDDGQIAASEVSGKIHFASGGSVATIGAESGVWSLCFRGSGQLFVGTRKNGIVMAGQSWEWKPLPEKPAPTPEPADAEAEANADEEEPAEEE